MKDLSCAETNRFLCVDDRRDEAAQTLIIGLFDYTIKESAITS